MTRTTSAAVPFHAPSTCAHEWEVTDRHAEHFLDGITFVTDRLLCRACFTADTQTHETLTRIFLGYAARKHRGVAS